MVFNSFQFLVFFIVTVGVYYAIKHEWRWLWLLMASCVFYMAFIPVYILILLVTIIIDYALGIAIETCHIKHVRKILLVISIVATCLVLAIFKYFNFFNANLALLAKALNWQYSMDMLKLALPIGLSFHTFQSLSYVIEVYRGNQKAERHFGIYALYVMFFPQLVAGPIERPQNLLHQFYVKHDLNYERITSGLRLMLWGLFKKVVIADTAALYVNQVYGHPTNYWGSAIIIATYCFALQIYCDFSGYTDIARGAARVMGFELMKNFKSPYLASSMANFWQRWHISLSTWFKDYVYIPLGGNRVGSLRHGINLLVVFMISGLWHGANWTFIIWGFLHGLLLALSVWLKPIREGIAKCLPAWITTVKKLVMIVIVFHLVCLTWVFFRAPSIDVALSMIKHIVIKPQGAGQYIDGLDRLDKFFLMGLFIFMEVVQYYRVACLAWIKSQHLVIRWGIYYAFIVFMLLAGTFKTQSFIYFQF